MKMKVIRIEKLKKSGTSKTGNPYSIDRSTVTVQVPFNTAEGFGFKEITYNYGDSLNFDKLHSLQDKLPLDVDIDLGVDLDNFGNGVTVVKNVNLPSLVK